MNTVTRIGWLLALSLPVLAEVKPECPIKKDEEAVISPAWAWQAKAGDPWFTELKAWVYEPEEDSAIRRTLLNTFRRQLHAPEEAMDNTLFSDRAGQFLVDNERGKDLVMLIHNKQTAVMPMTDGGGRTSTVVQLDWPSVSTGTPAPVTLQACEASGRASLQTLIRAIPPQGLTIISDIDDTIKISEVRDRQRLLARTFLMLYEAVPGMAPVYQAAAARGAVIHYLSASPDPLTGPLGGFIREFGFPDGPLHLRPFRTKSSDILKVGKDTVSYKKDVIRTIATRWPGRGLVLIGDSGERDPEIYADIARELGSRVRLIAIREVDGQLSSPRYVKTFRKLPAGQWLVFNDPTLLSAALQKISK